jgi:hypothetical protein
MKALLAVGASRLAFGVWRLALGAWRLAGWRTARRALGNSAQALAWVALFYALAL